PLDQAQPEDLFCRIDAFSVRVALRRRKAVSALPHAQHVLGQADVALDGRDGQAGSHVCPGQMFDMQICFDYLSCTPFCPRQNFIVVFKEVPCFAGSSTLPPLASWPLLLPVAAATTIRRRPAQSPT